MFGLKLKAVAGAWERKVFWFNSASPINLTHEPEE